MHQHEAALHPQTAAKYGGIKHKQRHAAQKLVKHL
jgi:hypothetical protein